MTGIAATGAAVKVVQSIPLILVYLATVGVTGFAVFKMSKDGSIIWHKILAAFTFLLGVFITVPVPKVAPKLDALGSAGDRVLVDIIMALLALTALVMAFLEGKKKSGGGGGREE